MKRRPKIKTALITSYVVIGVLFIGFGAFTIFRMMTINDNVTVLATKWMQKVQHIKELDTAMSDLVIAYNRHILATTDSEIEAALDKIHAGNAHINAEFEAIDKLDPTPEDLKTLKFIRDNLDGYNMAADVMLEFSKAGEDEDAKLYLLDNMSPLADDVTQAIKKIVADIMKGSNKAYEDSQADFNSTLYAVLGIVAVCIAMIGSMITFVLTGIAGPIIKITNAMKNLANGDTGSIIPFNGRSDEIGAMAGAVEVFRQTAVAKIESDARDVANRSKSEKDRLAQEEADRGRANAMAQATTGLGTALTALSNGDLTVQIEEQFATDFEQLRVDFNSAVTKLCSTLDTVARTATNIDNGSKEIAGSANDLSRRTEQQAAALEETAAALGEITVNVKSSSQRAEEARQVAKEANASATRSGEVVAHTVEAMDRIEGSSKQISNIIGVIDEIAFQTNLLALNAGVEAARAGDAGKGFAVVAQEVRELAQRSALAAKEIKGLIKSSTMEVATGVKLVNEAGEALKTISSFIVTMNEHMDAIATSSKEQSVGLAEVNNAVNQMDQTTQQNAAMVEETSAASGTLANESTSLREIISQFNLGNGDPGGVNSNQAQALHQVAARMASSSPSWAPTSRVTAKSAGKGNAMAAQEWSEF